MEKLVLKLYTSYKFKKNNLEFQPYQLSKIEI